MDDDHIYTVLLCQTKYLHVDSSLCQSTKDVNTRSYKRVLTCEEVMRQLRQLYLLPGIMHMHACQLYKSISSVQIYCMSLNVEIEAQ